MANNDKSSFKMENKMLANVDDIKKEIVANILNNDLLAIKQNLIALKEIGYTSNEAYHFISDLRKDSHACQAEDLILEVLDICSNYCGSPLQVWHEIHYSQ